MSDLDETFAVEGLEPLAIWDASNPGWILGPWRERAEWVEEHLGSADFIYRTEFYLIDTPFAVVSRFVKNGDGRKWAKNGEAVTETGTVLLTGLPPEHLLK